MTPKKRPGMKKGSNFIKLNITEENTLYNCYLPFLKNGGLFYQTDKSYELGDEVVLLLVLFNEDKTSIAGKVVWINPKGASGGRPAGIGVHFDNDEQNKAADARHKIENILVNRLKSAKRTYTM